MAKSTIGDVYPVPKAPKGDLGPNSAGQSGDTQGLSDAAESANQSVKELAQDGQAFEADAVEGLDDALDEGQPKRLKTHEVPEDDVPPEYQDVVEPPRSGRDS